MPALMSFRRAVRSATPALALGTAAITAALAACSDSPTAPVGPATSGPAFSKSATASSGMSANDFAKDFGKAAKDSAKAAKKAAKHTAKDNENQVSKEQLETLASTWHTTEGDEESGIDHPMTLACSSRGRFTVSQEIGKKGGWLHLGGSALTIPAGALTHTERITATATVGPEGVRLDFAPHGLRFEKAVELRLNYAGCDAPAGTPLNVYYTDATDGIRQVMPSAQSFVRQEVRALTDHFSGFLVCWGRR